MNGKKSNLIQGSMVAIVTPFNADGSVDFGAFGELIRFHREYGTSALFFLGVAGESSVLTDEEHKQIIEETVKLRPAGMPFFYGCTGINTNDTIRKVKVAESGGADGAMITVPANVGPDLDQAEEFFLTVANHTSLQLGTFNNPARLLTDLQTEQLLRIFQHPNYVLHKEGTARTGQIAQILRAKPPISFLGDDCPDPDILATSMALGAQGICNAAGNLAPAEMVVLSTPWNGPNNVATFRELYFKMLPLITFLYSARSPIAIKSLMEAIGLPAGKPRLPLRSLRQEVVQRAVEMLAGIGLISKYGYSRPDV